MTQWCAVVPILALCLSACSSNTTMPLQDSPQLEERIQEAIQAGRPVPLRQIVGGDWDRVLAFPGITNPDYIEEIADKVEYKPEFYTSGDTGILVFIKRGSIQRVVGLRPYRLDGNWGDYGADVLVTPSPPRAPTSLRFAVS